MILKDKRINQAIDARLQAGIRQELDVAFYLSRAFKNRDDVAVFNDLRIEHDGEAAQIDHLVITTLGFCLIESKSIRAQVVVNKKGEWTRVYNGKKTGIPSPIKQVELQEKILKALLRENDDKILGKIFGLIQTGFGGRLWKTICAISSDAVVDRDSMPKNISEKVWKSEFIADWVNKVMVESEGASKTLKRVVSTAPTFTQEEFKKICDFILASDKPLSKPALEKEKSGESEKQVDVVATPVGMIACKACKSTIGLNAAYGRYGYYVQCACGVNTSMKQDCAVCAKPLKLRKSGPKYFGVCENGHEILVFDDMK